MTSHLADTSKRLKLAAIISLSFALSFTVLFFTPMDLYLNNPIDFVVDWKYLIPPLLISTLAVTLILSTVLIFLWHQKVIPLIAVISACGAALSYIRFAYDSYSILYPWVMFTLVVIVLALIVLVRYLKTESVDVIMLAMLGVLAASYVQMLFLNSSMTAMTGDKAGYDTITFATVTNLLIWVSISLLPLAIWLATRIRHKNVRLEKVFVFVSVLIAGMQIIGLLSTTFATDIPTGYNSSNPYAFSYAPLTSLNADNNIVVFVIDRFDTEFMDRSLMEYPELNSMLDGFTYYQKNSSWSTFTIANVPTMLTQKPYHGRNLIAKEPTRSESNELNAFLSDAWEGHTLLDTLTEQGFTNNLVIDKLTTFSSFEQLKPRADNIEAISGELKPNTKEIISIAIQQSCGRLAPYLLKDFTLSRIEASFGNKLFLIDRKDPDVADVTVGAASDLALFDYIRQTDFDRKSQTPVFSFVHLNGTHADYNLNVRTEGYTLDTETGNIIFGGNWLETSRACFEILYTYFRKMEDVGAYDNTTIIIVADHGYGNTAASLLIKPRDSRGTLKIDNETVLSHDNFAAGILEAAGIEHQEFGYSYFDVINGSTSEKGTYEPQWLERRTE